MGNELLKIFRDNLKKLSIRDTAIFQKVIDVPPETINKLSDKAKAAFAEIQKREFGIPRESVRALTSAVLGEELPPIKDAKNAWIFDGCGVISIKMLSKVEIDGSDYYKKDSVLARLPGFKYDDSNCYKKALITATGQATSQAILPRESFRFATNEEISKYMDELPDAVVAKMMETVFFISLEEVKA